MEITKKKTHTRAPRVARINSRTMRVASSLKSQAHKMRMQCRQVRGADYRLYAHRKKFACRTCVASSNTFLSLSWTNTHTHAQKRCVQRTKLGSWNEILFKIGSDRPKCFFDVHRRIGGTSRKERRIVVDAKVIRHCSVESVRVVTIEPVPCARVCVRARARVCMCACACSRERMSLFCF